MEKAFERRPYLVPLTLALLTLIFLRHIILPPEAGYVLDGSDFRSMFYPLHEYIRQTLLSGELPLWNPHQMLGHPIIGNPHAALFYPATWFMWLVGVQRGMNLMLAFHMWLGAWGMSRLARSFGSTYVGGMLAGVVYAMSGWAAARFYIGHYNLYIVFGLVPWAMVAYRYALSRGTILSLLPAMAVLGAALLAGHPPMVLYLGIALVTLWAYHLAQEDDLIRGAWYAGWRLTAVVVGGLILGAALVIPAAELTNVSARNTTTDLTFANSFALPPAQVIDLALPGFFGNPKTAPSFYFGADFYEEFLGYTGLLPLLAIPLAFRWRKRESWYFIGLVALGLILAVGLEGALMPILWRWIPGFGMFRTPGRSLYFVMFGMAGLIGILVSNLQRSTPEERREALRPAVKLWIPIATVIAFVGAMFFAGWYASASHVEPMPHRAFTVASSLGAAGVILIGVWFVLWLWTDDNPKTMRWAVLLTCLLVILDAWHVGFPIITASVVQEDMVWAGARVNVPLGADARVVAPGGYENLASVTGHLNVHGYDPLPVETFNKLEKSGDNFDPNTPINKLLGVKYYLTTKPYDKPNWELAGITQPGIYYKRADPMPRAWVAKTITVEGNDDAVRQHIVAGDDLLATAYIDHAVECSAAGGTAEITDYRPNNVAIKTSGDGGLLVLSDQYYSGWQASIDDKSAEIIRTDTVFRGVCVPAGDHVVKFDYRPTSLIIGLALSVISWIALIVIGVLSLLGRRRITNI